MRTVSGLPWTIDGRWVVIDSEGRREDCLACVMLPGVDVCDYHAAERVVYDPEVREPLMAIVDCQDFIHEQEMAV